MLHIAGCIFLLVRIEKLIRWQFSNEKGADWIVQILSLLSALSVSFMEEITDYNPN